ncbi:hypothetical protein BCO_0900005 [Borrelia coriaceae ATCC 43381]|uniref:Uncharacterized protein n=1 Tax=Borrelia coriaceae ATCC 43381 TaxID=1408429 RepID=W5SUA5_9SPIR|nr:hypothetical protein BCO_0900005 [Borrelia coriaceae ATCC 43381]
MFKVCKAFISFGFVFSIFSAFSVNFFVLLNVFFLFLFVFYFCV